MKARRTFHRTLFLFTILCFCYGVAMWSGVMDIINVVPLDMDLYHFPIQNKTKSSEFPPSYEDLFIRFGNNKGPPAMKCNTCALVASSGILLNSKVGKQIDSNDCVIRMNDASTIGFEEDVGTKTTFRVFNLAAKDTVFNHLRSHIDEQSKTILVLVETPAAVDQTLRKMSAAYPESILYCYDRKKFDEGLQQFEHESKLKVGKTEMSCGWRGTVFARDICGKVNVFGMLDETFCMRVSTNEVPDVPYHYYNLGFLRQCFYYRWNQNGWTGHRYFTEKRIFKKWARKSKNFEFIYPQLDISED